VNLIFLLKTKENVIQNEQITCTRRDNADQQLGVFSGKILIMRPIDPFANGTYNYARWGGCYFVDNINVLKSFYMYSTEQILNLF